MAKIPSAQPPPASVRGFCIAWGNVLRLISKGAGAVVLTSLTDQVQWQLINVNQSHRGGLVSKKNKPMVTRIPITKARINLGQVVRRAHLNKEYFILEKDGIPVAGIMDVDEMEDYLELQDSELQKQIDEGYQEYRRGELKQDARAFLAELRQELDQPKRKGKRT